MPIVLGCFVLFLTLLLGPYYVHIILYCMYLLPLSLTVYERHHPISLFIFISLKSWSNPAPSMKGQLQLFFPWNKSCSRTEGLVSTWPYAKPFVFTVLNLRNNLAMLVLWGGKKIFFSRRRKLKLNEIHYLAHGQAAPYSMEEPDPDPRTC